MPVSLKLYPYKMGSESGKDLAQLLNIKRVRADGNYIPRVGASIINWGSSRQPNWSDRASARSVPILNKVSAVAVASNKLTALRRLAEAGIAIPEFTTSMSTAEMWLDEGYTVVERHQLSGNSGAGVRIVNFDDENVEDYLTPAPLYTKFIPKTAEFRVHVFRGQIIDMCEKKRVAKDRRPENFNKYVCSTEVGWVFVRNNIRDIPEVKNIAIRAVSALGLDFGAVDVVFSEGRAYVLEVNTAPGLMGTTLVKYANAFRRFVGSPDLPAYVVEDVMSRVVPNVPVVTSPAAPVASVGDDLVTLRADRATILKLKELLAQIS